MIVLISWLIFVGRFIVHRDCCAQVDGSRQTFLLHKCLPKDTLFEQLPDSSTHAVDIVSGLNIEGGLLAAFRGKELVFGIDKVLWTYSYILYIWNFF
jgi:hypothetical protein